MVNWTLRRWRVQRGLKQADAAALMNIDRSAYSRTEAGNRKLRLVEFVGLIDGSGLTDAEAMSLARELAGARLPTTTPAPAPAPVRGAA